MTRIQVGNGAPRSRLAVPILTCLWGDIPAIRWCIPPRPKAVAACCRDDPSGHIIVSSSYDPLLVSKVKAIEGRRRHPVEKFGIFRSYTHVSTKGIGKIKGPLDSLNLKEGSDK